MSMASDIKVPHYLGFIIYIVSIFILFCSLLNIKDGKECTCVGMNSHFNVRPPLKLKKHLIFSG